MLHASAWGLAKPFTKIIVHPPPFPSLVMVLLFNTSSPLVMKADQLVWREGDGGGGCHRRFFCRFFS